MQYRIQNIFGKRISDNQFALENAQFEFFRNFERYTLLLKNREFEFYEILTRSKKQKKILILFLANTKAEVIG